MEIPFYVLVFMAIAVILAFLCLWYYAQWFRNSLPVLWTWLKTEVASIGPVKKLLLVLFAIFSFAVIVWFINKMRTPIEENTKPAIKSIVKTVIGSGYAVTEGWDEEKMRHRHETGDYVPSTINTVGFSKQPNSIQGMSWTDYTIPVSFGKCTYVKIEPCKTGKMSLSPEGVDIYVSKTPGGAPDVIINSEKNWNLPPGEYYFSMDKELKLQSDSSSIVTISAWDIYKKQ